MKSLDGETHYLKLNTPRFSTNRVGKRKEKSNKKKEEILKIAENFYTNRYSRLFLTELLGNSCQIIIQGSNKNTRISQKEILTQKKTIKLKEKNYL